MGADSRSLISKNGMVAMDSACEEAFFNLLLSKFM